MKASTKSPPLKERAVKTSSVSAWRCAVFIAFLIAGCDPQGTGISQGGEASTKASQRVVGGTPSSSSSPSPAKWKEEPTSFMGIALDEPLTTSAPKTCPMYVYIIDERKAERLGALCHHDYMSGNGAGRFAVCCQKIEPFDSKVFVETIEPNAEGKVGHIRAWFLAHDAAQVTTALTVKYGPPHKQKTATLKNLMGAQMESEVLLWKGANVEIEMESLAAVDNKGKRRGAVSLSTAAYRQKEALKEAAKTRDIAGKL